jgi:hypothetical protein
MVACSGMEDDTATPTTRTSAVKPDDPGSGKPPGRGGGPSKEETEGNNLAVPLIFAEGIGLSGAEVTDANGDPVYANTGLRPTASDNLTVDSLPFSYLVSPGEPPFEDYYLQQTENVWQAVWQDQSEIDPPAAAEATVDWGDNLVNQTWTTRSFVRVETVLFNLLDANGNPSKPLLEGFDMTYLYGEGADEMWGTTGSTSLQNATIYSVCPRLTISKCQGNYDEQTDTCDGTWVTAIDSSVYESLGTEGRGGYGAEVNVAGRVIFGYNWQLKTMPEAIDGVPIDKEGWWRVQFEIDSDASVDGAPVDCNVALSNLHPSDTGVETPPAEEEEGPSYPPVLVDDTTSYIDIYVTERRTGRGGGNGPG